MLNNFSIPQVEEQKKTIVLRAFNKKRVFDLCFSLCVTILLLSWAIPIIALFIKIESKGPVFFKQLRTGKDKMPFYCLKFRSMRLNDESDHRQATKNDPRVTRIGLFMRKTNIDELPQFINVLRGEMSVVGPRPHMLKHTTDYEQTISTYMMRHLVLPGITGLAQVKGYRGETKEQLAMEMRVKADIEYIKNRTFLLDLKIILLTMLQVARRDSNAH